MASEDNNGTVFDKVEHQIIQQTVEKDSPNLVYANGYFLEQPPG